MTLELVLLFYVLGIVAGLALGYVVIRLAVGHALRSYAVWKRTGGLDDAVTRRQRALEEAQARGPIDVGLRT